MAEINKTALGDEDVKAVSGGVLSAITDKDGNITGVHSSVLQKNYYVTESDGSADMYIARAVEKSVAGTATDSELIETLQNLGVIS